jgi:hypothetical protein
MLIQISEEVQFDNGEGGFSKPFTERVTFTISGNTIEELAAEYKKKSQAYDYSVEHFEIDGDAKAVLEAFNVEINK